MSSNINQMAVDFFSKQYKTRPEVRMPSDGVLSGWMEEHRAEVFQSQNYQVHKLETKPSWTKLSGKIYTIMAPYLSAVFALYNDNTILWLDDHSRDTDFETFVRREQLLTWLPDEVDEVLELLLKMKFNFLGWPQLIHNASEIPDFSQQMKHKASISKEGRQSVFDSDKRLADAANQIHQATCTHYQNNGFQLKFHVWTKILGNLYEIRCVFGEDYSFRYEGIQLANMIGYFVMPR